MRRLDKPIEKVWAALTVARAASPTGSPRCASSRSGGDLRIVGGRFELHFPDDAALPDDTARWWRSSRRGCSPGPGRMTTAGATPGGPLRAGAGRRRLRAHLHPHRHGPASIWPSVAGGLARLPRSARRRRRRRPHRPGASSARGPASERYDGRAGGARDLAATVCRRRPPRLGMRPFEERRAMTKKAGRNLGQVQAAQPACDRGAERARRTGPTTTPWAWARGRSTSRSSASPPAGTRPRPATPP